MEVCFWSEYVPQHYLYCERQLCGWLQQPANTWSNIGYLIVSILVLRSPIKGPERTFFFWATFILFIGSTFFHMSGTHIGKLLDVGAMLILSMGICAISVQRWWRWDNHKTIVFYLIGLTLSLAFLFIMGFGNVPFALEIFTAAILEFRMIKEGRSSLIAKRLLLSCCVEVVAVIFLILDITQTWCDPDNHFINGHGLWHLISALAIYILFTARRSENLS